MHDLNINSGCLELLDAEKRDIWVSVHPASYEELCLSVQVTTAELYTPMAKSGSGNRTARDIVLSFLLSKTAPMQSWQLHTHGLITWQSPHLQINTVDQSFNKWLEGGYKHPIHGHKLHKFQSVKEPQGIPKTVYPTWVGSWLHSPWTLKKFRWIHCLFKPNHDLIHKTPSWQRDNSSLSYFI